MQRVFSALLIAAIATTISCNNKPATLFSLLDNEETGIKFQNTLFDDGNLNILNYSYFYNGGGVAIGDINNDGLQDILFTGNMVKNRLYLNKGNFKFENITDKAGIAEKQGWCTGATMVDINGDGKLDIYICRSADGFPLRRKNLLFINNGNLTFTEKAGEYGLDNDGFSTQASFFDYDKDGDLDMFLINHSLQKYTTGAVENPGWRNQRTPAFECKLYRNDWSDSLNHPFYTDVSEQAGIKSNVLSFGLGIAVSDINNDGWPDVYISNDFNEPDYLFMNNGNGTFSERLKDCMDQVSLFSMGSDAADFNNDGLTDLVTLDMLPEDNRTQKMHSGSENFNKFQLLFNQGFYYQYSRNMLQVNNGDGTFSETGQLAGISNTDWSWSPLFSDFNNDGYKDLLITTGYVKDYTDMDFVKYSVDLSVKQRGGEKVDAAKEYISKMPDNHLTSSIFENRGNGRFDKVNAAWGFDYKTVAAGAAYADLDNDGYMDIVVNNTNDFASVYKNNGAKNEKNNYLRIVLKGDKQNALGTGSKIKLFCKGSLFYQEQMPVRGFQSSVDPVLNFGIGHHTNIDSLIIIWPDDKMQKLTNIKPDQTITLNITDASAKWHKDSVHTITLFKQQPITEIVHRENAFNDFSVQRLLPNYLSRQGPCFAAADINKDGLNDVFAGGAKGTASQLFLQNSDGSFKPFLPNPFSNSINSEITAAEFFDADNDGDMDLYTAHGGYEFEENDPAFQDELYINDGKGNFTKSNTIPSLLFSKGCVKPADIDGDGDIDLFIGGRLVPGKYPQIPPSKILLNDGKGNFTDATKIIAPSFDTLGMVTDAAWIDVNNDKKKDLIVTGEWMPIKIFINKNNVLTDASSEYIKFPSAGWWNRLTVADMDNDGDDDIILGNYGLNTQFHLDEKEPMTLTYGDFDKNGSIDPVLCYYIKGTSYPAFSRDDLAEQLPFINKKFLTYSKYSTATLTDIFTPEQLAGSQTLKAEIMETIYLENKGNSFDLHHLPLQAQYSPVYAITAMDMDGDNIKDLLLTGNNSWTRIKFGRYTANHGIFLKGDGKGNFIYIPQSKSGLKVRGNVRSAIILDANKILLGLNDSNAVLLELNKNK
ncbi:MAG: VCBS repeat-containing protein [Bacteroidetes bacterium]|nr:VCBS repeat-containing protein [Bacteroidota bacterium]